MNEASNEVGSISVFGKTFSGKTVNVMLSALFNSVIIYLVWNVGVVTQFETIYGMDFNAACIIGLFVTLLTHKANK